MRLRHTIRRNTIRERCMCCLDAYKELVVSVLDGNNDCRNSYKRFASEVGKYTNSLEEEAFRCKDSRIKPHMEGYASILRNYSGQIGLARQMTEQAELASRMHNQAYSVISAVVESAKQVREAQGFAIGQLPNPIPLLGGGFGQADYSIIQRNLASYEQGLEESVQKCRQEQERLGNERP